MIGHGSRKAGRDDDVQDFDLGETVHHIRRCRRQVRIWLDCVDYLGMRGPTRLITTAGGMATRSSKNQTRSK